MSDIRKQFKLNKTTIDKLEKLKYAREQELIEQRVYEKDILVEAIDFYYSAKFGKDVFDQTMTKLENVLGNLMQNILDEYSVRLISSLDNLYFQNEEIKQMMLFLLKSNSVLPEEQNKINSLVMLNESLDEKIKEAVLMKMEISK